jgi:hypothetical protein
MAWPLEDAVPPGLAGNVAGLTRAADTPFDRMIIATVPTSRRPK